MKIYANIRISDIELHSKAKIRAAKEGKTICELTEKLWKEYLKKPLEKRE